MQIRMIMGKVQPEAYKALQSLDQYIKRSTIPPLHRELIKIRASQINGCAYCVHAHTRDALVLGETPERIFLISVWKEAGAVFTAEEQLLLEMTEMVTRIAEQGIPDPLYEQSIASFGEIRTAEIIMAIITINAWNRIGVSLHMHPVL